MRPTVEIAIPVYNEEAALEESVRRLHAFCAESLPWSFRIVIADNASVDGTAAIGARLAAELDAVAYVRLSREGTRPGPAPGLVAQRRRRRSPTWTSTSRPASRPCSPLVAPLVSGHSDLAIGTRLARGSRVVRGPKRELISPHLQPPPPPRPCAAASPTPSAASRPAAPRW